MKRINLSGSAMHGCNLRGADLSGANLSMARLKDANLMGANLEKANLGHAKLAGANLQGAILAEVDLATVDLSGSKVSLGASHLPLNAQKMLRDHALWMDSGGAEGKRAGAVRNETCQGRSRGHLSQWCRPQQVCPYGRETCQQCLGPR
jgi:hypothetical protein